MEAIVYCAGCGKNFDRKKVDDTAPKRIPGCCPECNKAVFRAAPKEEPKAAPKPVAVAKPAVVKDVPKEN